MVTVVYPDQIERVGRCSRLEVLAGTCDGLASLLRSRSGSAMKPGETIGSPISDEGAAFHGIVIVVDVRSYWAMFILYWSLDPGVKPVSDFGIHDLLSHISRLG